MKISGRAWILGDGIDTDVLAPGAYMSASLDILSSHCLAAVRPDFASAVRTGDVILAGSSFGVGSSREQAAEALKITANDLHELGLVDEVVPEPFGGAHNDYDAMADILRDKLITNLEVLQKMDPEQRLKERYQKYRRFGQFVEG